MALLAAGCAAPQTAPLDLPEEEVEAERRIQSELAVDLHIEQQTRMLDIGMELLRAAADLCEGDTTHSMGVVMESVHAYPEPMREFVADYRGLEDDDVLVSILPVGMPAAASGLMPGDRLMELNGVRVSGVAPGERERASTKQGINEVIVERGGERLSFEIESARICDYGLQLNNTGVLNAYARAGRVIINSGVIDLLDDGPLRQLIAHEIAHLVQGHDSSFGILLRSVEFEAEADYVGLYIYARAGYPVEDALPLWRELAARARSILFRPDRPGLPQTHPSPPERFVAMAKTIEEIRIKQAAGEELVPNLRD